MGRRKRRQHAHNVQPTIDAMRKAGASKEEIAAAQREIGAIKALTPEQLQQRQDQQRSASTLRDDGLGRNTRSRAACNKSAINDF